MERIADLKQYNSAMSKAMEEKLFFLNEVPELDFILDFGCADGAIIERLLKEYPNAVFVGYDNNPDMIEIARERLKTYDNVVITSSSSTLDYYCRTYVSDRSACLLSSVLHEVYSYEAVADVKAILVYPFKYFIVRDMYYGTANPVTIDINEAAKKVSEKVYGDILRTFQDVWGEINTPRTLTHFLLKYRYAHNWDRELLEDYLPYQLRDVVQLLNENKNYEATFLRKYTLPFLKEQVKADFGLDLVGDTHYQMILRRKHE